MDYRPKYIADVSDLTEEQRGLLEIKDGDIDPELVYRAIFDQAPDEQQIARITHGLEVLLPRVTRCHRDLMRSEFGKEKILLKDARLMSDVFDDPNCHPYDANVKKLNAVLDKLKEELCK